MTKLLPGGDLLATPPAQRCCEPGRGLKRISVFFTDGIFFVNMVWFTFTCWRLSVSVSKFCVFL